MIHSSAFGNIEKMETDLWEAADTLRGNSKLTSSEYCMPVLGVIFLRHAANRFEAATHKIADDQASGKMPKRKVRPEDYVTRRALFLPELARYDRILATPKESDLGEALVIAMNAIEESFEPLIGVLPKDFSIFERTVLEDLLKIFNREALRSATGDVFGRIYEYFLMKFAMQGAQDNGDTCYSRNQAEAVVQHIPAAIGMKTTIGDDAARVFAAAFYSAISFGLSVTKAFDQAKAALMLECIPEQDTPELFIASGVKAEELVLVKPPAESQVNPQSRPMEANA